ncbi:MAG TPA: hypothetical protein VF188_05910 [Longimicrobiales bacterium]
MIFRDRRFRVISLTCLLAMAGTTAAAAQDRRALADLSEGSRVTAHDVVRLSFAGLDLAPDALARVFRLPGGGWGVSAGVFRGVIQRFDRDGAPAGTFGRSGEGPGELGGQVFGVPMDDELWIVDPRNGRLSVFAEDLSHVGDRPLPGRVFSVAPAAGGRGLLISGFMYGGGSGETRGVARISLDEGADAFGGPIEDDPNPRVQIHMAAETPAGEVWTVAVSGGAVDILKSDDLSLLERLRLPGEELAQVAPTRGNLSEDRPAPQLAGITADSTGLLWIAIAVADREWAPGLDPDDGAAKVYDTRILAVDPAERAVIGKVRLDDLCLPVEGRIVSCVDELGEAIRLVTLAIER